MSRDGSERVLAVCADDFGLAPAVDDGILALAQRGRLHQISCLSAAPFWAADAPRLAALPPWVQTGLHFNLSEGAPAGAAMRRRAPQLPALPKLMATAFAGRLPRALIEDEWQAQWELFVRARGRAPDYVDGHQHVHQLPGVRAVVLDAASRAGVPVRNTGRTLGPGDEFKRQVIERSGGRALQRELRARGIAHNAVLVGVYGFGPGDYRQRVRGWLQSLPAEGGLLFCHPAAGAADASGDAPGDPIAAARRREAAYLGSAAFVEDLMAAGVRLGPAWTRRPSAG